jgi:hypothetical protein
VFDGFRTFSGCVDAIAADPTNANNLYIATASGGVWKTTNATSSNVTWTPLTDNQATLDIGAIALAPSNTSVIYAGTGDPNNANGSVGFTNGLGGNFAGKGILKSTDGGSTWTLLGQSTFTGTEISKIVVDPANANNVYVAVQGYNGAPGSLQTGNVGVWKSTDGGNSWTNTTTGISGLNTSWDGFSDLVMDPSNSQTLYTALNRFLGTGSTAEGVYKTTNGGSSWTLQTGLPTGSAVGRTFLAISKTTSPVTLYVLISGSQALGQAGFGLKYKFAVTTDGGSTWTDRTTAFPGADREWNTLSLAVDPTNANIVYNGGSQAAGVTTDGGQTWKCLFCFPATNVVPHVDSHAMTFDANGKLVEGDDGGVYRLDNPDTSNTLWSDLNGNLNTIQFDGIALNPTNANIAYGGAQDNGPLKYTGSAVWGPIGTGFPGGDAGVVRVDFTNPNTLYSTSQYQAGFDPSFFARSDDGGSTWNTKVTGINTNEQGLYYPTFVMDPSNSSRLVLGLSNIYETTNKGDTWTQLGSFPGNDVVDSIGLAASDSNTIYAATYNHVYLTTNHGLNWTQVTDPDPGATQPNFTNIVVDPANPKIAYIVAGDVSAYTGGAGNHVWMTNNSGSTWTNLTGNLPDSPVTAIVLDSSSSTLYVATEMGVYSAAAGSTTWSLFGTGLPNVRVTGLELNKTLNVLAAGTYGRGLWEISLTAPGVTAKLSGSTLQIVGTGGGATVVVRLKAGDATTIEVLNNGSVIGSFTKASVNNITVNLAGNANLLTVDDSNGDPVPTGGLSYEGGVSNQLVVDGSAVTAAQTITLDSMTPGGDTAFGTITGEAAGVISFEYADTSSATLKTGTGSDSIVVLTTGTATTINVDGGSDSILVGSGSHPLSGVAGALTVNGVGGGDSLYLEDAADSAAATFFVTSTTIQGGGSGLITYGSIPTVTIDGGSGNNTFNVESTAAGTSTTIDNGLAGSHTSVYTVNVSPAAKLLDNIQGALALNFPVGTVALNLNDLNYNTADTYTLTASTVTRGGTFAGVTYGGTTNLTLNGGNKNDTYEVNSTNGAITINGGAGDTNFYDNIPGLTTPLTFNGGAGNNWVIGPGGTNTWNITSINGGTLDGNVTFSSIKNIETVNGTDTFVFSAGKGLSGVIFENGTGTLDYHLYATAVTVNLLANTATGTGRVFNIHTVIGSPKGNTITCDNAGDVITGGGGKDILKGGTGNDTFILGATQLTGTTVAGGGGTDNLVGANLSNVWTISSANGGKVNATVTFSGIANLVGGTNLDVFKFSGTGSVAGTINGGGAPANQGDWLDYSSVTYAVSADLSAGTASNTGGVSNIQNVHGGNHGNTLKGNSQGNILIGGLGTNTITGGSGMSILILNKGSGTVTGGSSAGDILIGDSTNYDTMTAANEKALMGILAEWQSADSYATRFHDINTGSGGGLNGTAKLNWALTVKDDAAPDAAVTLTAKTTSGLDWFFADTNDTKNNFTAGDHLDNT